MIRFLSDAIRVVLMSALAALLAACAADGVSGPGLSAPSTGPAMTRVEQFRAVPTLLPTPVSASAPSRPWSTETKPVPTPAPTPVALTPHVAPPAGGLESGLASYYWQDQMTASGERFDKRALTAAHRTLPFGTMVRVTSTKSGKSVVVRINDRGPFKPGRIIDLSEAAAEQIEMTKAGITPVTVDRVR